MAKRRSTTKRRWFLTLGIATILTLLLFAASIAAKFIAVKNHVLAQTVIPTKSLQLQTELYYPLQRYETQGNRYIWGHNDCSTFVTDYMLASGKPAITRLTTKDLFQDKTMEWRGFSRTEPENIRVGDIIVYRYKGRYGTMVGHTGIVYKKNDELHVVHNSLTAKGIISNTVKKFMADANRIATTKTGTKNVKVFTRSDYEEWQSVLASRQATQKRVASQN